VRTSPSPTPHKLAAQQGAALPDVRFSMCSYGSAANSSSPWSPSSSQLPDDLTSSANVSVSDLSDTGCFPISLLLIFLFLN
jgi:hypothetical protein